MATKPNSRRAEAAEATPNEAELWGSKDGRSDTKEAETRVVAATANPHNFVTSQE